MRASKVATSNAQIMPKKSQPPKALSLTFVVQADENDADDVQEIMGDIFGEEPVFRAGMLVIEFSPALYKGSDGGDELLSDLKRELMRANIRSRAMLKRV